MSDFVSTLKGYVECGVISPLGAFNALVSHIENDKKKPVDTVMVEMTIEDVEYCRNRCLFDIYSYSAKHCYESLQKTLEKQK